jgi:hypothetical protein
MLMIHRAVRGSENAQKAPVGILKGGSSSVVERQLPKLNVAGSIPVSRSIPQQTLTRSLL